MYFHRSMLNSSTKVVTSRFVRHLENLGTTPLFNDTYFRSRVMSQLGGCNVFLIQTLANNANIKVEHTFDMAHFNTLCLPVPHPPRDKTKRSQDLKNNGRRLQVLHTILYKCINNTQLFKSIEQRKKIQKM